ncbi:hypothetical protein PROFUN_02143 [Planoprotostelium fungivorum]|uniref:PA domain-containing protein n=1 Tax=Planoprotostelium fungivorum TaxID=1890364 RepID=A0A2P6NZB6_9EUKA|nr:hypothetical protein PROFUN_02143 [Planoprotostelium fungivorum]
MVSRSQRSFQFGVTSIVWAVLVFAFWAFFVECPVTSELMGSASSNARKASSSDDQHQDTSCAQNLRLRVLRAKFELVTDHSSCPELNSVHRKQYSFAEMKLDEHSADLWTTGNQPLKQQHDETYTCSSDSLFGHRLGGCTAYGPLPPIYPGLSQLPVVFGGTACTVPSNGTWSGSIVMLDRGSCLFPIKTYYAQLGGAMGVILVNRAPVNGEDPVLLAQSSGLNVKNVFIPSTVVSHAVGDILKRYLNANLTASMYSTPMSDNSKDALSQILPSIDASGAWNRSSPWWAFLKGDASQDPCLIPYRDNSITCNMFGEINSLSTPRDIFGVGVQLGGFFSSAIGRLTELYLLSFPNSGINGNLPNVFSSLSRLIVLRMDSNKLFGQLPPSLFQLPSLWLIAVQDNEFVGSIPSASTAVGLRTLLLDRNMLNGSLPADAFALPQISYLGLSSNRFTGGLPQRGNSSYQYVDFSSNQLSGELQEADFLGVPFIRNRFHGKVPTSIFTSAGNLDISYNLFDHLSSVVSTVLKTFDASNNPFNSAIPYFNAPSLTTIKMSQCGLYGWWPDSILNSIQHVNMSFNPFHQDFVDWNSLFAQGTTTLQSVICSHCNLTGSCNALLSYSATALMTLDLSHNELEGHMAILDTIVATINYLDYSYNQISGPIPEELALAPQLTYINYEGNRLMASGNRSELPSFLKYDFQVGQLPEEDRHALCPWIDGKFQTIEVHIDASYYNYTFCRCTPGYVLRDGECHSCPQNSYCPGGQNNSVIIQPGYFPLPSSSDVRAVVKCRDTSLNGNPCNPDGSANFHCDIGYTGRLCSDCEDKYFHSGNQCLPCRHYLFYLSIVGFVLMGSALLIYVAVVQAESWNRSTVTILVFYMQTTGYLLSNGFFPISDNTGFLSAIYSTSFFRMMGFECYNQSFTYFYKYLVVVTTPLYVIFLVLLVVTVSTFFIRRRYRQEKNVHIFERVRSWAFRLGVYTLKLLYFPVTVKIFSIYNCVRDPISEQQYLNDALYLPCSGSSYRSALAASVVLCIFFSFGLIALLFFFLRRYRPTGPLGEHWISQQLGVLYLCYRPKRYYIEVYFIYRRLSFAVITAMVEAESPQLSALTIINCVISLVVQVALTPFAHQTDNYLELASLSIITISYIISVLEERIGFPGVGNQLVQWILFLVNVIFVAITGGLILYSLSKRLIPESIRRRIRLLRSTEISKFELEVSSDTNKIYEARFRVLKETAELMTCELSETDRIEITKILARSSA